MTRPTHATIAANFDLWQEYIDTEGVISSAEFEAMTTADRMALIVDTFGPEPEVPTVDHVLDAARVAPGVCAWDTAGGRITLPAAELQAALEEAYDPTMSDWTAMVELPND